MEIFLFFICCAAFYLIYRDLISLEDRETELEERIKRLEEELDK